VAAGADPAADRAAQRRQSEREKCTVAVVCDDFVERYAQPKIRSWKEYQRILGHYVKPAIGSRPIHALSRRDVTALLDRVADDNGIVMSDHVLAIVRKLFNWHAARDDHFHSPIVIGMSRTSPRELARNRVLTDDEVRAVVEGPGGSGLPVWAAGPALVPDGR